MPVYGLHAPLLMTLIEGDRLIIGPGERLSGPLHPKHQHESHKGVLRHDALIGKPAVTSSFRTNKGFSVEVSPPTLEQWISNTTRKVTPIYSAYASLITSLLDIHVDPPTPSNLPTSLNPPLEILEAGTGHGSLTLHLARAIAAANPPPPPPPSPTSPSSLETYRATRRAILHTVELSPSVSQHAAKLISQFRQGLYHPHIDFHVSSVSAWLDRNAHRGGFLSHILLDLPAVHTHIQKASLALQHDGTLTAFAPSITQIADCVRAIGEAGGLALRMERVVELGEGISTGRLWDVRMVKTRRDWGDTEYADEDREKGRRWRGKKAGFVKALQSTVDVGGGGGESSESTLTEDVESAGEEVDALEGNEGQDLEQDTRHVCGSEDTGDSVFVCRPLVGKITKGGGFVGMWRKIDSNAMRAV